VLSNLGNLHSAIEKTAEFGAKNAFDAVVGIDFKGFNMRVYRKMYGSKDNDVFFCCVQESMFKI
jgi:lipid A disaccharide synthetase